LRYVERELQKFDCDLTIPYCSTFVNSRISFRLYVL
jgi:hypothetical protein